MKHKHYHEIDTNEYNSLLYVKRGGHLYPEYIVAFTRSEANKLEEWFRSEISEYTISKYNIRFSLYNYNIMDEVDIFVDKVEDEWFLVIVKYLLTELDNYYYKCDQVDGLLTFLNNIKKSCLRNKCDTLMENTKYDTYKEIDKREYFDLVKNAFRSVDESVYDQINKIDKVYVRNQQFGLYIKYSKPGRHEGDVDIINHSFVSQLPDEWFCIKISYPTKYFKCDQIEGVIDCLKEIYSL